MFVRQDALDAADELETQWRKSGGRVAALTAGRDEQGALAALSEALSSGALPAAAAAEGLLFHSIATAGQQQQQQQWRLLTLCVPGWTAHAIAGLRALIATERFTRLTDGARTQTLWALGELLRNAKGNTTGDGECALCVALLRHVATACADPQNVLLAEKVLALLKTHAAWALRCQKLVAHAFYTFTRLAADHSARPQLSQLRQAELSFCATLWDERPADCLASGRDLLRILGDVARLPEAERVWKALFSQQSVLQLGATPTPKVFPQSRLTPEMERQLMFIMTEVRMGHQKRYQAWFAARFLATSESEALLPDLIRFVCCCWHPPNAVLCSDIVPRWAVIGWLLKMARTEWVAANCKLALFLDWLFFDPRVDSIMNIEPAVLLMLYSLQRYPDITESLAEFLVLLEELYFPNERARISRGISNAFAAILEKGVVNSLEPILSHAGLGPQLQQQLRTLCKKPLSSSPQQDAEQQQQQQPTLATEESNPALMEVDSISAPGESSAVATAAEAKTASIEQVPAIPFDTAMEAFSKQKSPAALHGLLVSLMANACDEGEGQVASLVVASLEEEIIDCSLEAVFVKPGLLRTVFAGILAAKTDTARRSLLKVLFLLRDAHSSVGYRLFAFLVSLSLASDPSMPLEKMLSEENVDRCLMAPNSPHPRFGLYNEMLAHARQSKGSSEQECFLSDFAVCGEQTPAVFSQLLPFLCCWYPQYAVGQYSVCCFAVFTLVPSQLHAMECRLTLRMFRLFGTQAAAHILESVSNMLQAFELEWMWRLANAEFCRFPSEIYDLAMRLLPKINPEAPVSLAGVHLMLRHATPSPKLLVQLLSVPSFAGSMTSALLVYWNGRHGGPAGKLQEALRDIPPSLASRVKMLGLSLKADSPIVERRQSPHEPQPKHPKRTTTPPPTDDDDDDGDE